MWNDSFGYGRRKRPIREILEITEIIASGRKRITQKDINRILFDLWDAGMIIDKDGKYKDGSFFSDEEEVEGSDEPKYRRILRS